MDIIWHNSYIGWNNEADMGMEGSQGPRLAWSLTHTGRTRYVMLVSHSVDKTPWENMRKHPNLQRQNRSCRLSKSLWDYLKDSHNIPYHDSYFWKWYDMVWELYSLMGPRNCSPPDESRCWGFSLTTSWSVAAMSRSHLKITLCLFGVATLMPTTLCPTTVAYI